MSETSTLENVVMQPEMSMDQIEDSYVKFTETHGSDGQTKLQKLQKKASDIQNKYFQSAIDEVGTEIRQD